MKYKKNYSDMSKKAKFKPGSKKRENKCIVTFNDEDRQEYLTGFHKRKVERRKAAVAELQKKIKEEQIKVREQRHKEYIKMLKERRDALEEDQDDLEGAVTATTECVQYDHPNHTVTVTTISDLDLTADKLLGLPDNQVNGESGVENENGERKEEQEKICAMPKKAGNPILNKKIRSLSASLSAYTKQNKKGKQNNKGRRGLPADKRPGGTESKNRVGRTTKKQRRRRTGKRVHNQD